MIILNNKGATVFLSEFSKLEKDLKFFRSEDKLFSDLNNKFRSSKY